MFKHHARLWFAAYLVWLLLLTLSPFEFSVEFLRRSLQPGFQDLIFDLVYIKFYDMAANWLLFLPCGFILYFLNRGSSKIRNWRMALLTGGLISLTIEITQLFLERSTNGMDVIMNALGSMAGFILATWLKKQYEKYPASLRRAGIWLRGMAVILYTFFVVWLFLFPRGRTVPVRWNTNFPLVIGNEGTGDRPWHGEIYWIALYDQALTRHQVHRLKQNELKADSSGIRREMGVIAAYPLTEGRGDTLHDLSGYGPELPLTGRPVQWLPGRGILCQGGMIRSVSAASKISRAVVKSRAFSIEVKCKPGNLTQGGPARIVSLSPDAGRRNFSLVQEGRQIRMRFRTQMGGWNGSYINLRARNALDSTDVTHLVATYNHGVEQLFVNGKRHRDVIYGHISYLSEILGLGREPFAQVVLVIVLLFPLSVLTASLFRRQWILAGGFYVMGVVFAVDLYYVLNYHAPICFPLLMWTFISVVSGALFFRAAVSEIKS